MSGWDIIVAFATIALAFIPVACFQAWRDGRRAKNAAVKELQDSSSAGEVARRNALLKTLRGEYVLSHSPRPVRMMAGTEWPDPDWLNRRLGEMSEPFRVEPGPDPSKLFMIDITPQSR